MNCTRNTLKSLNDQCLKSWANGSNDNEEQCFSNTLMGTLFGNLAIISSSIGFFGNLLTILAVTYCVRHKRYLEIESVIYLF